MMVLSCMTEADLQLWAYALPACWGDPGISAMLTGDQQTKGQVATLLRPWEALGWGEAARGRTGRGGSLPTCLHPPNGKES